MQEERLLLKKQNFLFNKILCICVFMGLICFPFLSDMPKSDYIRYIPLKTVITYSYIMILIGISAYLLYELNKYLKNFEKYNTIQYVEV